MAGDSMRELVVDTIKKDYKKGFRELPFWGRELGGFRQPENSSDDLIDLPFEDLEILLHRVDNETLLEILDSQACEKYR